MRALLLVAAVLASVVVLAPRATAQPAVGVGWTLEPATASGAGAGRSYFEYSLSPGEALQDYVKLSNLGDRERTFVLYAADAYTTEQGGFALRLQSQPRDALGSWVSLPFTTRTVAPRTSITFPFQLGIPRETAPGDWAGGIVAVASDDQLAAGPQGSGVHIQQGVAARIYTRVKGPLHADLSVEQLTVDSSGGAWAPFGSKGDITVHYEVVNSGNVRLAGSATIEITDMFGRTVKTFPARHLPELLPRDHTTATETWTGAPLIGFRYRARLVLDADGVRVTRSTPGVWNISLTLVLALVALAVLIRSLVVHRAAIIGRLRRRPRELVPT